ncbi:hypothetical protein ACJ2CR_21415 [Myxococcus faecalis]|uniref:hypothetical protein n=1 Tax=Myxococcus faecalis TaxID=3115646 RepID=UPI0038D0BDF8
MQLRPFLASLAVCLSLLACGGGAPASEPVSPEAPQTETSTSAQVSCWDECYQANAWCPSQCGVSSEVCAQAISVCYDSCERGVGPWLPC